MSPSSERCTELADPNIGNFAVSVFILVGILVSYLPQHVKIVMRRSSEGLSPWFVLLGTTSGTCQIANILVLPASRQDVGCCDEIGGFACGAALLGIAQVGAQWSCFFVIMLLFLVFFPRDTETAHEAGYYEHHAQYTFQQAITVVVLCIAHFFAVFLISIIIMAVVPDKLQLWANVLGILGTVLASVQYFPQIYTTWKLQDVYSLSIPMMLIQTPGSFVFAISLAVRLGPSGWSAWGVYIVTGILQGILLGMGVWFWYRDRKEQKVLAQESHDQHANGGSEQTPLLQDNATNGRD